MSFPLWLHYIHWVFCVWLFTTTQPANFLLGEELTCSSEDFNQRKTRWWATVRSTPCPGSATVLNLGSHQRYEGHRSPHPMYSRLAPTVCDEVNRSGLHMSSLPSFSFTQQSSYQSNNMIHTTTNSCVMWSRGAAATWFP